MQQKFKAHTSKLCIGLLDVTQGSHELLTRDWFSIVQRVTLGKQTQLVGQHVGIRRYASHTARHVTVTQAQKLRLSTVHSTAYSNQFTLYHINNII